MIQQVIALQIQPDLCSNKRHNWSAKYSELLFPYYWTVSVSHSKASINEQSLFTSWGIPRCLRWCVLMTDSNRRHVPCDFHTFLWQCGLTIRSMESLVCCRAAFKECYLKYSQRKRWRSGNTWYLGKMTFCFSEFVKLNRNNIQYNNNNKKNKTINNVSIN